MAVTFDTFTITPDGGHWLVYGDVRGRTIKYGTISRHRDQFVAARMLEPGEPWPTTTPTKVGDTYQNIDRAARALVKYHHHREGTDMPLFDNTKETEVSSMPSLQVIYDAHVTVNIAPDGTMTAELLIANYDDGPQVNDAEGRTLSDDNPLRAAAWEVAGKAIRSDAHPLTLEEK